MHSHTAMRSITACLFILSTAVIALPAASALEEGQKFKDWSARCETPKGAEQQSCYIFQRLVTRKDDTYLPVLHVLVGYITADGKPGLFATVPLGVSLRQGLKLSVDSAEPVSFGYSHCNNQGCLGALALSDELIARMRAGKQALITFHSGAQQPVTISVSLQGFTAGFNALR
ncbi:MAG: invasion associated locus B family protein [Gammaproteobacteria bacterium]|nr:invasion associated locus B family protein [Gammaproteobacteria bacterium]MDH3413277.1 invasion associated locus B family protein [Gammaproteobacteria bacterium]